MSDTNNVRKYRRGKEDIDLDKWLNNVQLKWGDFEKSLVGRTYTNASGKKVKITDEDMSAIKAAYDDMYRRLNSGDNSLEYNYTSSNRGFLDRNASISNDNPYYGIVSSFFGNQLRSMDPYSEPQDPNKIKYGEEVLGDYIMKELLGSAGTVQDFIDLDKPDPTTGARSNIERTKRFKGVVDTLLTNLKNNTHNFTDYNDEQRLTDISNIEKILPLFSGDGQITDNEYLQLAKTLGIKNLRTLFNTKISTDDPSSKPVAKRDHNAFLKWNLDKYGRFTDTPLSYNIKDYDFSKYGPNNTNTLINWIRGADSKDLLASLNYLISGNDPNLEPNLRKLIPSEYIFGTENLENARKGYIDMIMQVLHNNKELDKYAFDDGYRYYIPNSGTDRHSAFVWNSKDNTITEQDANSIPYIQNQRFNEWLSLDPSTEGLDPTYTSYYDRFKDYKYKDGGVLFASSGTVVMDRDIPQQKPNPYLNVKNTIENAEDIKKWDNYYKLEDILNDLSKEVNGKYFWDTGTVFKDKNGDEYDPGAYTLSVALNNLTKVGANLFKEKASVKGYKTWNEAFDKTGLNRFFGKDVDKFDDLGPTTWSRNLLIGKLQSKYTKDNPFIISKDGKDGIYFENGTWKTLQPPVKKKGITKVDPSQLTHKNPLEPYLTKANHPHASRTTTIGEGALSNLERSPYKAGSNFFSFLQDYSELLPESLRLRTSLNYNKKIEKAARPHLAQYNPIFLERQITGDLASKLASDNAAAHIVSATKRNLDSDPNRNAAMMHQAYSAENRQRTESDLRYNQSVEKSAEQQFNLRKENKLFNYNNVYKPNIELRTKWLDQIGYNRAKRLNGDWRGINEFMKGISSRVARDSYENKQTRDAIAQHARESYVKNTYKDELEQIQQLESEYEAANPNTLITNTPWYARVQRRKAEIKDRMNEDLIRLMGQEKGIDYYDPYRDNPYILMDWSDIIK